MNSLNQDECMSIVSVAANGLVLLGLLRDLDDEKRERLGKALVSTRAFLKDNSEHVMNEAATAACVSAIDKLVRHMHGLRGTEA